MAVATERMPSESSNTLVVQPNGAEQYKFLIVVPAHNEAAYIGSCLDHVLASRDALPDPMRSDTHIVVVCDQCHDGTADIAANLLCPVRDRVVACDFKNVGSARALGARIARQLAAVTTLAQMRHAWYAFTDADTIVPADWLTRQFAYLQTGTEILLGTVQLNHFDTDPSVRHIFETAYLKKIGTETHRHIHGANMGVRLDSYWSVGGFQALAIHEDRDLVTRLQARGSLIARDRSLTVSTSGRFCGRTPAGIAYDLHRLSLG